MTETTKTNIVGLALLIPFIVMFAFGIVGIVEECKNIKRYRDKMEKYVDSQESINFRVIKETNMKKDIYSIVERQFKGHGIDYLKKEEIVNECTIYHFESQDEALEGMSEVLQAIYDNNADNFNVALESNEETYKILIKEL